MLPESAEATPAPATKGIGEAMPAPADLPVTGEAVAGAVPTGADDDAGTPDLPATEPRSQPRVEDADRKDEPGACASATAAALEDEARRAAATRADAAPEAPTSAAVLAEVLGKKPPTPAGAPKPKSVKARKHSAASSGPGIAAFFGGGASRSASDADAADDRAREDDAAGHRHRDGERRKRVKRLADPGLEAASEAEAAAIAKAIALSEAEEAERVRRAANASEATTSTASPPRQDEEAKLPSGDEKAEPPSRSGAAPVVPADEAKKVHPLLLAAQQKKAAALEREREKREMAEAAERERAEREKRKADALLAKEREKEEKEKAAKERALAKEREKEEKEKALAEKVLAKEKALAEKVLAKEKALAEKAAAKEKALAEKAQVLAAEKALAEERALAAETANREAERALAAEKAEMARAKEAEPSSGRALPSSESKPSATFFLTPDARKKLAAEKASAREEAARAALKAEMESAKSRDPAFEAGRKTHRFFAMQRAATEAAKDLLKDPAAVAGAYREPRPAPIERAMPPVHIGRAPDRAEADRAATRALFESACGGAFLRDRPSRSSRPSFSASVAPRLLAPSAVLFSRDDEPESEPESEEAANGASNDASNGASNGASTAPPDPDEMEDAALTEAAKYVLASRGRWSVESVLSGALAATRGQLRNRLFEIKRRGDAAKAKEDAAASAGMLWADAYAPARTGEVVGDAAAARTLKRWLGAWKTRVESEAVSGAGAHPGDPRGPAGRGKKSASNRNANKRRRRTNAGADREGSHASDSCDSGSDSDDPMFGFGSGLGFAPAVDRRGVPATGVLLAGPVGCGKTAAAYAAAKELGFKVLEVNASRRRSGAEILARFGEATQSKRLGTEARSGAELGFGVAGMFKASAKAAEAADGKASDDPSGTPQEDNTLILFEEVDVLRGEDRGFVAALATLVANTKRPIVLTSNASAIPGLTDAASSSSEVGGASSGGEAGLNLARIRFRAPDVAEAATNAALVSFAEGAFVAPRDVAAYAASGNLRRGAHSFHAEEEGPLSSGGAARGDARRALHAAQLLACGRKGRYYSSTGVSGGGGKKESAGGKTFSATASDAALALARAAAALASRVPAALAAAEAAVPAKAARRAADLARRADEAEKAAEEKAEAGAIVRAAEAAARDAAAKQARRARREEEKAAAGGKSIFGALGLEPSVVAEGGAQATEGGKATEGGEATEGGGAHQTASTPSGGGAHQTPSGRAASPSSSSPEPSRRATPPPSSSPPFSPPPVSPLPSGVRDSAAPADRWARSLLEMRELARCAEALSASDAMRAPATRTATGPTRRLKPSAARFGVAARLAHAADSSDSVDGLDDADERGGADLVGEPRAALGGGRDARRDAAEDVATLAPRVALRRVPKPTPRSSTPPKGPEAKPPPDDDAFGKPPRAALAESEWGLAAAFECARPRRRAPDLRDLAGVCGGGLFAGREAVGSLHSVAERFSFLARMARAQAANARNASGRRRRKKMRYLAVSDDAAKDLEALGTFGNLRDEPSASADGSEDEEP